MTKNLTMDDLLTDDPIKTLNVGEVYEGSVLDVHKNQAWIDLGEHGIGMVSRRELGRGQTLKKGQTVNVSIIDPETDDGYAIVSLRKAAKDKGWDELAEICENKEIIDIQPYDANRGGLLVEFKGIRGFLPVSQLSADNYPRVAGADKDEILQRLNSLTKKTLKVRILDVSRKDNKLIFSEKEAIRDDMQDKFEKLTIGDSVKGTITGVVDFGAFVNVSGIEGLVHISEISWDRVENPSDYVKVGEVIEAKIIAIDKDRLSLSIKQMQEDPWVKEVDNYKKGDTVKGKVTRITPFGAFIQISKAVEALVHISELGDEDSVDPEEIFKLNEEKEFSIIDIDKENRKISLSLKDK